MAAPNTVTLLLLAAMALIGVQTEAQASDHRGALTREIERVVTQYAFFTVFDDVGVDVDGEGIAVLVGSVTSRSKRTDLAKRVSRVPGVVGVRNDIDVLPISPRDTALRYAAARAIYGSSAFWQAAARRNPPIHVVVNDGRITLTGTVDTESERALAGMLAAQGSASDVLNKLRVAGDAVPADVDLD